MNKILRSFKKSRLLKKRRAIRHAVIYNLAKRRSAEKRFQFYGMISLFIAIAFLALLMNTILGKSYQALSQHYIQLELDFSDYAQAPSAQRLQKTVKNALNDYFPEVQGRVAKRQLYQLVSRKAGAILQRDLQEKTPDFWGQKQSLWVLASSDIDMFYKGYISETTPETKRKVKDLQIAWLAHFEADKLVQRKFNHLFFTEASSSEPETAGVIGGLIGTIFILLSCLALAFPLGVLTAVYLEEFAPKNRFTRMIEVNINNLAAVPSIIFGLLGLVVYIQFFGIPRSSSLAGGLTLGLMALPVIVIATRTALRAIPHSIRDAAIALGASKNQMVFHHVVPLATPGIMTGVILSLARVLGETAPLLMIGMIAFVADIPGSITEPANALPVLVYLWSDMPELGFTEKTSAAILVLLVILVVANFSAAFLRKKYETKW